MSMDKCKECNTELQEISLQIKEIEPNILMDTTKYKCENGHVYSKEINITRLQDV